MYDVTVLDTKTKQLVNHFNLDKEDSIIDLINYRLLFEGYKMGLQ